MGHGKTEAYFFPPLDVPPYNLQLGPVKTRLGLKHGTTEEQVCRSYHVTCRCSCKPVGVCVLGTAESEAIWEE